MVLKLIVAMCKNNGIGIDNKIPWRISEDMSYFSKKTSGDYGVMIQNEKQNETTKKNAVIMGRNTWESLPKKYKPLPNRFNIVLTSNVQRLLALDHHDADKKDIEYVSSLDGAIDLCYGRGEKGEKNTKKEYLNTSQFLSCKFNDIWIIGGSSLYKEFIHRGLNVCNNTITNIAISNYYITYIDKEYECDIYFPMLENMNTYHLTQFEKHECIDKNTPNAPPLNIYYIVFKKIKYTDDKIIEELFTPYRSNNGNNGNNNSKNIERDLLFYIKKTKIDLYLCSKELEILFSMFHS
jgi:dihydrofolate reductase